MSGSSPTQHGHSTPHEQASRSDPWRSYAAPTSVAAMATPFGLPDPPPRRAVLGGASLLPVLSAVKRSTPACARPLRRPDGGRRLLAPDDGEAAMFVQVI